MPIKKRSGTEARVRKPSKKKAAGKKKAEKSAENKPVGKKAVTKSAVRKKVRKIVVKKMVSRESKSASKGTPSKMPVTVQPGPAPGSIPPVEEPSRHEEAIGVITHYYSHLGVALVQVNKGALRTGDTIHITGHSTDFTQAVASMEYEHRHVDQAEAGQSIGLKVADHAREHDIVYLVK
jgi:hypothetical protein